MADEGLKLAKRRLAKAQEDRRRHEPMLEDIRRYVMPWRPSFGTRERNPEEVNELFDSTALNAHHDFIGDMLSTLTPMYAPWLMARPAKAFGRADLKQLEPQLEAYTAAVFGEIRRSNFFEAAQECYRDLGHGTMSILIEDPDKSQPLHCQAVTVTELDIARGPRGTVDGRFRHVACRRGDVETLWPTAKQPEEFARRAREKPDEEVTICEGLIRDWSDRSDETWRFVVWVGNDVLLDDPLKGRGCCHLIVARWSADSSSAWGIGPLYNAIADVKTSNKAREQILRAGEKALDPVVAYDDDGVVNVDQGIEPGTWVPRSPGSSIDVLESSGRVDVGILIGDDLVSRIREALFQDGPRQVGATPPTATQWMDEAARKAKRIGAPFGRLVTEWLLAVFQRFAYLLQERGVLPKVELNGDAIALDLESPLLMAQRQEAVVRVQRYIESLVPLGPQMMQVVINPLRTAEVLREGFGVPVSVNNTPQEIQQVMQAAAQAAQAAGAAPA